MHTRFTTRKACFCFHVASCSNLLEMVVEEEPVVVQPEPVQSDPGLGLQQTNNSKGRYVFQHIFHITLAS